MITVIETFVARPSCVLVLVDSTRYGRVITKVNPDHGIIDGVYYPRAGHAIEIDYDRGAITGDAFMLGEGPEEDGMVIRAAEAALHN